MPSELKLIIDPPLDGPANMAVDDCLHAKAETQAALRLYRWREPTISLGYFQNFDDPGLSTPDLAGLPLVRRVTGGGAILHADELTYSIAIPADHALAGDGPQDLYIWMHDRIIETVRLLGGKTNYHGGNEKVSPRGGPFLCFARHASFDLMDPATGNLKFVGSAQRRTRKSIVQHGSIILHRSHRIQPSTALDEIVGRSVSFEEFAGVLVESIRSAGVEFDLPEIISKTEGKNFVASYEKHKSDQWLKLR